jgi:Holliday junction resolvase RusA-like endonuclease
MLEINYQGLPVSLNSSYATNFKTGRRFKSKKLSDFKKDFTQNASVNVWSREFETKATILNFVKEIQEKPLVLTIQMYMLKDKLYTKKGTIKKMDVDNKIKCVQDAVCKMLGIDDSQIFRVVAEKRITKSNEKTIINLMVHR